MSYDYTVTLITPAANSDTANKIARAFDPDIGGQNTFKIGYSNDGNEPITHYIAHTWARESFIDQINSIKEGNITLKNLVDSIYSERWSEETPPTKEECDEFWSSTIIEIDRNVKEVLTENNLQTINLKE